MRLELTSGDVEATIVWIITILALDMELHVAAGYGDSGAIGQE